MAVVEPVLSSTEIEPALPPVSAEFDLLYVVFESVYFTPGSSGGSEPVAPVADKPVGYWSD